MSETSTLKQEVSDTITGLIRNCFRERKGEGIYLNMFYESRYRKPLLSFVENGRAEEVIEPITEMLLREADSLWETEAGYQLHLSRNGHKDTETYIDNNLQEIISKRNKVIKAMNAPEEVLMTVMNEAREPIKEIFRHYKPVSVRGNQLYDYR